MMIMLEAAPGKSPQTAVVPGKAPEWLKNHPIAQLKTMIDNTIETNRTPLDQKACITAGVSD